MVEVVGSARSRAGPMWSSLGSQATHVWREEEEAARWFLSFEWKEEEKGRVCAGVRLDPEIPPFLLLLLFFVCPSNATAKFLIPNSLTIGLSLGWKGPKTDVLIKFGKRLNNSNNDFEI